jgi:hypothetical protein
MVSRSTKLESDGAGGGMEVCKMHDDAVRERMCLKQEAQKWIKVKYLKESRS